MQMATAGTHTRRYGIRSPFMRSPHEVGGFVRARPARSDAGVSGASRVIANYLSSVVVMSSPGPERRNTADRLGMIC